MGVTLEIQAQIETLDYMNFFFCCSPEKFGKHETMTPNPFTPTGLS